MEDVKSPVMDVVAAPPRDADEAKAEALKHEAAKPAHHDKKPVTDKPARKQHDGNVIAAIVATVIIVLGLSALAVFAYLKQTGRI